MQHTQYQTHKHTLRLKKRPGIYIQNTHTTRNTPYNTHTTDIHDENKTQYTHHGKTKHNTTNHTTTQHNIANTKLNTQHNHAQD